MKPHYTNDMVTLYAGDCLDVLAELGDASVDAVVTDPPYGLGFMGREWDAFGGAKGITDPEIRARQQEKWGTGFGASARPAAPAPGEMHAFQSWCEQWATECRRVLKPGGHLLAFGGTRTWHRLATAIEDAGFEIRDSIAWIYGSGFPKSLDVSKAIDKANGRRFEDRFALGRHIRERRESLGIRRTEVNLWLNSVKKCEHYESQNASDASVPTLADWLILRERLGLSDEYLPLVERAEAEREVVGERKQRANGPDSAVAMNASAGDVELITAPATPEAQQWQGWGTALKPAHEPIVVARKPLTGTVAANVLEHGTGALNIDACRIEGDVPQVTQGLSSDPSSWEPRSERRLSNPNLAGRWPANVVLDQHQAKQLDQQSGTTTAGAAGKKGSSGFVDGYDGDYDVPYGDSGGASRFFYIAKAGSNERPRDGQTAHPTVKPLDLMRWLVRLVTPPDGIVLDPFAGSGTTAEACIIEGFNCILIEREPDYLPLIEQRLNKPTQGVLL